MTLLPAPGTPTTTVSGSSAAASSAACTRGRGDVPARKHRRQELRRGQKPAQTDSARCSQSPSPGDAHSPHLILGSG